MDNENIQYLGVRQALADLAHFIEHMRETIPGASQSKVIIAGGSYSATMVTWFKKLYPELATGAWASSAPLFAKVNFVGEYWNSVVCHKKVLNGNLKITKLSQNVLLHEFLVYDFKAYTYKKFLFHAFFIHSEYKEITGQSIRLVAGEQCYNRIQNGIAKMEELFANKRGAEVKAILKLCDAFDEYNDLDLWTLFSEISDIFAGVVQTHKWVEKY